MKFKVFTGKVENLVLVKIDTQRGSVIVAKFSMQSSDLKFTLTDLPDENRMKKKIINEGDRIYGVCRYNDNSESLYLIKIYNYDSKKFFGGYLMIFLFTGILISTLIFIFSAILFNSYIHGKYVLSMFFVFDFPLISLLLLNLYFGYGIYSATAYLKRHLPRS